MIPWCLANTALAAFLYYYDAEFATMFSTTDKGHTFLSACVSYLLVSRTKICLDRYHAQRQGLSNLVRTCRELVSHSIVFTRFTKTDEEGLAELKQWRTSIAKRTISLLKVIVSILQYPTTKRDSWEIEDLPSQVKKALKIAVGRSNERSPLIMTLFLRTVIMSHEKKSFPPLKLPQEMLLLQYTTDILKAYTGIMDYMSSPYPFPLMNMNRTIVLFYIFTLPFALVNDIKKIEWCFFMTFFITYGILGLELICVELDDPFGEDPNDFDVNNIARVSPISASLLKRLFYCDFSHLHDACISSFYFRISPCIKTLLCILKMSMVRNVQSRSETVFFPILTKKFNRQSSRIWN